MTVPLGDLLDEMAAKILAVVGPAVPETEVQVVGRYIDSPTPPTVDIYPGDPFRDGTNAAFHEIVGEYVTAPEPVPAT